MATVYLSLQKADSDQYHDCVQEPCLAGDRSHDKLWSVQRRAYDSGLYWPYILLNGERTLIEGSLPNVVKKIPNDAMSVTPREAARLWHDDNESHVFGGPNVAKKLRETIADANAR